MNPIICPTGLKDFLIWLDDWQSKVEQSDYSAAGKAKMMLSRETLVGIRITGN